MFSDHTATSLLNFIVGGSSSLPPASNVLIRRRSPGPGRPYRRTLAWHSSLPSAWVALFTTAPSSDSGSGALEPSSTAGYLRAQTGPQTWTLSGSDPVHIANQFAVPFPAAAADWGTLVAWGLYDAPGGGNLLTWDWLGTGLWSPTTISLASPAVLTWPSHGLSVGNNIAFTSVFGGTAPGFSQSNLTGLLAVASTPSADTFTVTNGGTAVNTSSTGSGGVRKVAGQHIPAFCTASVPAGSLLIRAAT